MVLVEEEKFLSYKKDNENNIVIIRNGFFYYCYGEDAYIISYLFHYKLLFHKMAYVSFNDLTKVLIRLKKLNIGYIVIDKEMTKEYGDTDIYLKYYSMAYLEVSKKNLLDEIVLVLKKLPLEELQDILDFYKRS